MKNIENILWGIVFIIIGIIVGINALGIVNINLFFSGWWTLIIIIPCFIGLFGEKEKSGNVIRISYRDYFTINVSKCYKFWHDYKIWITNWINRCGSIFYNKRNIR